MKVTMKEIAERAGVHPSTVDKVVHHRVGVSDEVRARVQAIINELGYTPNPSGRMLQRQGKVYRISAILVEVDALPYLKKGIERGVKEQTGFDIEVSYAVTGFQEAKQQSEYIDVYKRQGYDQPRSVLSGDSGPRSQHLDHER